MSGENQKRTTAFYLVVGLAILAFVVCLDFAFAAARKFLGSKEDGTKPVAFLIANRIKSGPPAPTPAAWANRIVPPTAPERKAGESVFPAGPGREVVLSNNGLRSKIQQIPPSGDLLPGIDIAEIRARKEMQEPFPKATLESVEETYNGLNAKDSPGYSQGLLAVQLFAILASAGESHGECWYQAAAYHAYLAKWHGSRDILVNAIDGSFRVATNICTTQSELNIYPSTVLELQNSAYPPSVKIVAALAPCPTLEVFVKSQADPGMKPGDPRFYLVSLLDACVARVEELARQGAPLSVLQSYTRYILEKTAFKGRWTPNAGLDAVPLNANGPDRAGYEKRVAEAVTRGGGPPEVNEVNRAKYLIALAWDTRRQGPGYAVTVEDASRALDYFSQAENILAAASRRYPDNVYIPTAMIDVAGGKSYAEDVMERWFRKVEALRPKGYYPAYESKLVFFHPDWGGSFKKMQEFGLECARSEKWEKEIPLIYIVSADVIARHTPDYFEKNPAVVDKVGKIYQEYLRRYPESVETRTSYLSFAFKTGNWPEVKRQLAALHGYWDMFQISDIEYARMAFEASRH